MNLTVCGLVRNAAVNLQTNLSRLDQLRPHFHTFSVLILENDSTDGTKEILSQYARSHKNVLVQCEDFQENPFQFGPFSMHRISLMAKYRNAYLEKLKEFPDTNFVLVIDLDIYFFDIQAVVKALHNEKSWHMLSAFGSNYVDYKLFPVFYDIYAYMDHSNQGILKHYFKDFQQFKEKQRKLYLLYKRAISPIPVMSNFNGLAIYPYEVITSGALYGAEPCTFEGIESYCEHAVFHKELIQNSFDRLYIDPKLRVIYEKPNWALHLRKYVFYKLDYYARKIYGTIYPLLKNS